MMADNAMPERSTGPDRLTLDHRYSTKNFTARRGHLQRIALAVIARIR
jgi:hypothetical protein